MDVPVSYNTVRGGVWAQATAGTLSSAAHLHSIRQRYNPHMATPGTAAAVMTPPATQESRSDVHSDEAAALALYAERQHRLRQYSAMQTPPSGGRIPWRDVDNPRLTPPPTRHPPMTGAAIEHQEAMSGAVQQQQQQLLEQQRQLLLQQRELLMRELRRDGSYPSATQAQIHNASVGEAMPFGMYGIDSQATLSRLNANDSTPELSVAENYLSEGAIRSAHNAVQQPPRHRRHEIAPAEPPSAPDHEETTADERDARRTNLVRGGLSVKKAPQATPFNNAQVVPFSDAMRGQTNGSSNDQQHTPPVSQLTRRGAGERTDANSQGGRVGRFAARQFDEGDVFNSSNIQDAVSDFDQAKSTYYSRFTRTGPQVGERHPLDGLVRAPNTVDTSPAVALSGRGRFNTPLSSARHDVDEVFSRHRGRSLQDAAEDYNDEDFVAEPPALHKRAPPLITRFGGEVRTGDPVPQRTVATPTGRRRTDVTDFSFDPINHPPAAAPSTPPSAKRPHVSPSSGASIPRLRPPEFDVAGHFGSGDDIDAPDRGGDSDFPVRRALLEKERSGAAGDRGSGGGDAFFASSTSSWPLVDEVLLVSPITVVEECRGETRSLVSEMPKNLQQAFHHQVAETVDTAGFFFCTGHEQGAVNIFALNLARRKAGWQLRMTRSFTHLHIAPVTAIDCTNGILTSASMDGSVRRTDCSTGVIIATFSIVGLDVRDFEVPHPLDAVTMQQRSAHFRPSLTGGAALLAVAKSPVSATAISMDQNLIAIGTSRGTIAVYVLSDHLKPFFVVEGDSPIRLNSSLTGDVSTRLTGAVLAIELDASTGNLIAADHRQVIFTNIVSQRHDDPGGLAGASLAGGARRIFYAPGSRSFAHVCITRSEIFAFTFDGWAYRCHRYVAGFSSQDMIERGAINIRNASTLAQVVTHRVVAQDRRIVTADLEALMRVWSWESAGYYGTSKEDAARDPIPKIEHVQDVMLSRKPSLQHVIVLFNRFCLIVTDVQMELYNCKEHVA